MIVRDNNDFVAPETVVELPKLKSAGEPVVPAVAATATAAIEPTPPATPAATSTTTTPLTTPVAASTTTTPRTAQEPVAMKISPHDALVRATADGSPETDAAPLQAGACRRRAMAMEAEQPVISYRTRYQENASGRCNGTLAEGRACTPDARAAHNYQISNLSQRDIQTISASHPPALCMHTSLVARRPAYRRKFEPRRSSSRAARTELASSLEGTPGDRFEEIMLTRYFCGTTCSLNPALHRKTMVRATLVSVGASFSEVFMEKLLKFWFGGSAACFAVRKVHEGVFEFQTASADVASEIVLGGRFSVGPICMDFALVGRRGEGVDAMHACHDGRRKASEGTAVNHQAKSRRSTCSARTQAADRRDNSGHCCAALPFQYGTESLPLQPYSQVESLFTPP
jgi:hypothetical protein